MNPEVENNMQESASERMDIQMGEEEAKRDLADVKKASGQSRESQMETAVKKLLGPTVQGMTLADIMKLSDEEIQNMIDGRKRKTENMQKIGKYVGKLIQSFGSKDEDGKNIFLEKLGKIVTSDPEKLSKGLKDFPPATREEVMAVFTAFVEIALQNKVNAAFAPVYASFVIKLFTDKEYLALNRRGVTSRTKFEKDLEERFAKLGQDVGAYLVHGIFGETLKAALMARPKGGIAGFKNPQDIEARLGELAPRPQVDPTEMDPGQKLGIAQTVAHYETQMRGSFESQRVAKLRADVGKTLNAAVDGLFEGEESITISGYEPMSKEALQYNIIRFEGDEVGNWGRTTTFLYAYLSELERGSRMGDSRKRQAEKIAKLRTVIASRNALDFLRHSGSVSGGFVPFYDRHFRYQIAVMKSRNTGQPIDIESVTSADYNSQQFTEEQRQQIASATATHVRESVIFMVSNVYRNYLNMRDEPKEAYQQALQHGGDQTSNPAEMFRQLNSMLGNLAHQSTNIESGNLDFTVTTLGGMQALYDPSLGKDISTFSSLRTQTRGKSMYDFLNELKEEINADDGFFEAGHQYRYLSHMGSPDAQKKFFQSIGEHLKTAMTSRNMDRIYSMEDNVYITRSASFIETILKKRMGEKGWINEDEGKFFNEIFLNRGAGGKTLVLQVQEFLEENYPHLPDWQRRRVLQHAFTIVFAGRFRFQQIFSYANPTRGYQGQADDKQMFNNVFAPFQRAMRFPTTWDHDLFLKGAYWQPMYNMPGVNQEGKWDPFAAGQEGYKVFDDQRHESQGRLAWDMTKHFQGDLPEMFAPINRLKAGGYDTLRGWRRMADMGVIDKKIYSRLMGGGQPQFKAVYEDPDDLENGKPKKKYDGITRIWKSVENIGVNEINAFADENIISMIEYDKDGKLKNPDSVNNFIDHLYTRYLNDQHEFGKHLPHNYLFADVNRGPTNLDPFTFTAKISNSNMYGVNFQRAPSKEKFIELFHARAEQMYQGAVRQESGKNKDNRKVGDVAKTELKRKLVKPMLYDAMMVVIAERSPVEFLYRLRNQDEQNGLRLSTQIKNKYFDEQSEANKRAGSFMQTLQAQGAIHTKIGERLRSSNRDDRQAVKDEIWDEVTDDLAYAQGELRGEVDEEILQKRTKWEGKTHGLNIYGENWDQTKSSVNGGRGYVMDDETLIRIMVKKYQPEVARQILEQQRDAQQVLHGLLSSSNPQEKVLGLRIQRAVLLRKDIIAEMGAVPDINTTGEEGDKKKETEHILRKKYLNLDGTIKSGLSGEDRIAAQKYIENHNKRINRARWMRRMWDEGFLGAIPFMADNSEVHKVFLNGDDTMVYRSTGECSVAEQYKLILDARAPEGADSNMLLMLKAAARKGTPETWSKIKSLGTNFRKICSDEIGDGEIFMPVVLGLTKMQLSGLANKQDVRNALGRWKMIFDKDGQSLFSKAWTNFEHNGMDAVTIRQFLLQVSKTGGINPAQLEGFASFFQASWFHVAKELIPEYLTYILAFAMVSYVTDAAKRATSKK
jgi:hypothetical protein